MFELRGKSILVGVSGGIAAYKTCGLVSKLVQSGADVNVMMTKNATEFVAPLTFETLSHNRVVIDMFDRNFTWETEHISLAKKADAVIIAPATANIIAKLAHGIADDFVTTTVLACKCPIIFAPAMNCAMLGNSVTEENINKLVGRGFIPVYGREGYLACGITGNGRMAEINDLTETVVKLFSRKDYAGKTVLVTAGATVAPIDPVRFISNRSSGKMGYAVAMAAARRGAKVIFIAGRTEKLDIPSEWITEQVATTEEMFGAVKSHIDSADVAVMAAAPCDYKISPSAQKIKSNKLVLELEKTVDIAASIGTDSKVKLVIFAAETENCERNARGKLDSKNADMVVLNDVTKAGAGFDVDTNIVTIITKSQAVEYPVMKKLEIADIILDKISEL